MSRLELSEGTNGVTILHLGPDYVQGKGIYVDISVDIYVDIGVTVRFLVHTGSSVSLLSKDVLQEHFAGHADQSPE